MRREERFPLDVDRYAQNEHRTRSVLLVRMGTKFLVRCKLTFSQVCIFITVPITISNAVLGWSVLIRLEPKQDHPQANKQVKTKNSS